MSSRSRPIPLGRALLAWVGAQSLRLLGLTWRVRYEGTNPVLPGKPPVIGAIWHRNLFLAAVLFRGSGIAVPVSHSRDGELVAGVLWRLGFAKPPRGSSSRGGAVALRQLMGLVEQGVSAAILTDGPKGPARQSKPGVVALAGLTGAPIAPASLSAHPCVRVRSWDGSLLPLPFARVVCRFGELIEVVPGSQAEAEQELLTRLDALLNRDTDALDDALGLRDSNRADTTCCGE